MTFFGVLLDLNVCLVSWIFFSVSENHDKDAKASKLRKWKEEKKDTTQPVSNKKLQLSLHTVLYPSKPLLESYD